MTIYIDPQYICVRMFVSALLIKSKTGNSPVTCQQEDKQIVIDPHNGRNELLTHTTWLNLRLSLTERSFMQEYLACWFHLVQVQEQAGLICGDGWLESRYPEARVWCWLEKVHQGTWWRDGNTVSWSEWWYVGVCDVYMLKFISLFKICAICYR